MPGRASTARRSGVRRPKARSRATAGWYRSSTRSSTGPARPAAPKAAATRRHVVLVVLDPVAGDGRGHVIEQGREGGESVRRGGHGSTVRTTVHEVQRLIAVMSITYADDLCGSATSRSATSSPSRRWPPSDRSDGRPIDSASPSPPSASRSPPSSGSWASRSSTAPAVPDRWSSRPRARILLDHAEAISSQLHQAEDEVARLPVRRWWPLRHRHVPERLGEGGATGHSGAQGGAPPARHPARRRPTTSTYWSIGCSRASSTSPSSSEPASTSGSTTPTCATILTS